MQARIMAGGCAGVTRRGIVPAFASLLLLAFLTIPAAAQDGPRHAAIAKKAAVALAAHLQEIAKAHRRPDYGKPPLSQYLRRVFDDAALMALPPAKGSDISWLLDWSSSSSQSYKKMVFFGVTSSADMKDAVGLNMIEDEDAIVTGAAFEVHIIARMMQTMPLFMASLPPEPPARMAIRKAGMQRAQHGMVQTVRGSCITLTSHLKPQNALILANALRDTAAVWTPLTSAQERAKLLKLLETAHSQSADIRVMDALNAVKATVSSRKD